MYPRHGVATCHVCLQVRCLLAHMLLCSLARGPSHRYWVTLQPWVTRDTRPALAYLACLLDYFDNEGGTRVPRCNTVNGHV